jgi:hypothetical protein
MPAASRTFSPVGSRGLYTNQLPLQYEVLGALLRLPPQVNPSNGKTYLQEAQVVQ